MTRHFDGSSVYSEQQRPVRCLPERLIGDRRPLESTRADQLASSLNIEIENTLPYRADWKGGVWPIGRCLLIKASRLRELSR
jgi:hypothetical protein